MDENKTIVSPSPFCWSEKEQEFFFYVAAGDTELGCTLFPPGIIESLVENEGECDIVVCGCGDAGCAGFFNERFRKTEEHVVWEMQYGDVYYEIVFERAEYERDALRVLHHMVKNNVGWNAFDFTLYRDIEEFRAAVKQAESAMKRRIEA